MFTFIGGFMIGGFMGFIMCAVLHVERKEQFRDRRGPQKATFPLTDHDGVLALDDRRRQPDRRLRTVKTLP
jgi:hypothetical protein